jgi:hypothetical protein
MGRAPTPLKRTSDPAVVLDVLWRDRCLFFVLKNISDQSMRDIRIAFRRKVIGMGGAVNIAALPIWSTLALMPPGKEIEVTIDRDTVFYAHNKTGPLAISITYTDGNGTTWRAQISHDFEAYRDFPDLRIV